MTTTGSRQTLGQVSTPSERCYLRDDLDETHHPELGMLPAVLGVHKAHLDIVTGPSVQDLFAASLPVKPSLVRKVRLYSRPLGSRTRTS